MPGPFGNIDQRVLGRSIAAVIALHSRETGEVIRENAAMKNSLRISIPETDIKVRSTTASPQGFPYGDNGAELEAARLNV